MGAMRVTVVSRRMRSPRFSQSRAYVESMDSRKQKRQTGRLNELIVHCHDDNRAYRAASRVAAAMNADASHHAELLVLSRRRASFAAELSALVREMGASPSTRGSLFGWMRGVRGTADLGAALAACERAEARAIDGHRRALELDWSSDVLEVLESQLREIERDHARFRGLGTTS